MTEQTRIIIELCKKEVKLINTKLTEKQSLYIITEKGKTKNVFE